MLPRRSTVVRWSFYLSNLQHERWSVISRRTMTVATRFGCLDTGSDLDSSCWYNATTMRTFRVLVASWPHLVAAGVYALQLNMYNATVYILYSYPQWQHSNGRRRFANGARARAFRRLNELSRWLGFQRAALCGIVWYCTTLIIEYIVLLVLSLVLYPPDRLHNYGLLRNLWNRITVVMQSDKWVE